MRKAHPKLLSLYPPLLPRIPRFDITSAVTRASYRHLWHCFIHHPHIEFPILAANSLSPTLQSPAFNIFSAVKHSSVLSFWHYIRRSTQFIPIPAKNSPKFQPAWPQTSWNTAQAVRTTAYDPEKTWRQTFFLRLIATFNTNYAREITFPGLWRHNKAQLSAFLQLLQAAFSSHHT